MSKESETGPCAFGQHAVRSIMLGMIAERHPPDSPLRAKLEAFALEVAQGAVEEGSKTGDLFGAFEKRIANLKAWESQKEADRNLREIAIGIEGNKAAIRTALLKNDLKTALEERAFFLLKFERYRNLEHHDIQLLIRLARLSGDSNFFKRFGRELSKKPKISGPQDIEADTLRFMLFSRWVQGPQGEIGLCRLTDKALTDYCSLALNCENLTLDFVCKTRQRLGLIKGARPWFRNVRMIDGKFIIS